jgi:transcriptional regulator with XRE-family HTH domain
MIGFVDDARIGRSLRLLRQRRGLRQRDLAAAAGLSQSTISTIEAGHLTALSVATMRRVFAEVGASFESAVRWRGAALERLLDQRHAELVSALVARLRRLGWGVEVEVSYSVYGERGSIDILGGHPIGRAVLVAEVKSELVSIEEPGRKTDEKLRLARQRLCRERFGWTPQAAGRLLVLPASDAARRSVRRNAVILDVAFPSRGSAVREWLKSPHGALSGVLFVADINRSGVTGDRRGVRRVRVPREGASERSRPLA